MLKTVVFFLLFFLSPATILVAGVDSMVTNDGWSVGRVWSDSKKGVRLFVTDVGAVVTKPTRMRRNDYIWLGNMLVGGAILYAFDEDIDRVSGVAVMTDRVDEVKAGVHRQTGQRVPFVRWRYGRRFARFLGQDRHAVKGQHQGNDFVRCCAKAIAGHVLEGHGRPVANLGSRRCHMTENTRRHEREHHGEKQRDHDECFHFHDCSIFSLSKTNCHSRTRSLTDLSEYVKRYGVL